MEKKRRWEWEREGWDGSRGDKSEELLSLTERLHPFPSCKQERWVHRYWGEQRDAGPASEENIFCALNDEADFSHLHMFCLFACSIYAGPWAFSVTLLSFFSSPLYLSALHKGRTDMVTNERIKVSTGSLWLTTFQPCHNFVKLSEPIWFDPSPFKRKKKKNRKGGPWPFI